MNPAEYNLILGPPGTGKTWTLMGIVEQALKAGTPPDRIGYLAFTRKAADIAKARAPKGVNFPHFRTIHSLAFRQLGLNKDRLFDNDHLAEFADLAGLHLTGKSAILEGGIELLPVDDRLMFLEHLARIEQRSLRAVWEEHGECNWFALERIAKTLAAYKEEQGVLDFTDMLIQYQTDGVVPALDLLLVDETQDLSALQWKVIHRLASHVPMVYVAGDDDQAIFRWAGADVGYFQGLQGPARVLGQSYRVPKSIQKLADSVISRCTVRRPKAWEPRNEEGQVNFESTLDAVDMSEGTWLVLARNGYILNPAAEQCRREGFLFARYGQSSIRAEWLDAIKDWERMRTGGKVDAVHALNVLRTIKESKAPKFLADGQYGLEELGLPNKEEFWYDALTGIPLKERSYYRAALRRGEKITKEPRIRLSTIHGAKGEEAENVVLLTDVAAKTFQGIHTDDEQRVQYVGVTRASQCLFVINPRTRQHFEV